MRSRRSSQRPAARAEVTPSRVSEGGFSRRRRPTGVSITDSKAGSPSRKERSQQSKSRQTNKVDGGGKMARSVATADQD